MSATNSSAPPLSTELRRELRSFRKTLERFAPEPDISRFGTITRLGDGVVTVAGLERVRQNELLVIEGGGTAFVVRADTDQAGCVLVHEGEALEAGRRVWRSGAVVRTPVGEAVLGRVLDPLGRPLDGGGEVEAEGLEPIERPAPAIVERDFVRRPLHTGLLVVDAMLPLGRGQRELVLGDRKTGKTSLAVDAILAQKRSDVISIYAAIGQKTTTVGQVVEAVRRHGPLERTIFVVGAAETLPGLQWLVPYAACTIGEWFRDRGRDVLIVYDDLTRHADVHRQLALLLRLPPGREAFPGDVFYLHSRLLERSAQLSPEAGGGSLSALPIAETAAGNIAAYIPTNLISITDGQIYLEPRLFHAGQKPAVDVGLSVSRVGGRAQPPVLRELAARLRLEYARFLEVEHFARFGGITDPHTLAVLRHGRRIRFLLSQPRLRPYSLEEEVVLLIALNGGRLDPIPEDRLAGARLRLLEQVAPRAASLAPALAEGRLDEAGHRALLTAVDEALRGLVPETPEATGGE